MAQSFFMDGFDTGREALTESQLTLDQISIAYQDGDRLHQTLCVHSKWALAEWLWGFLSAFSREIIHRGIGRST
jgi:hypothetical protein